MKIFVVFIIILFLFPLNIITEASTFIVQPKLIETTEVTPSQLSIGYSKLLNTYVQSLIGEGEKTGANGLRWKKYLNLPANDPTVSQYYFGLYYGAAGIGSLFLKLYETTNNVSYLNTAVAVGNYLVFEASNTSYGIVWSRSEDSTYIYSSEKYGIAGIATFLLSLSQDSKNQTYLDYAINTLQLLFEFRNETPFGYSFDYSLPESAQITDYIYGVTGIAKAYLKAYQVTRNSTYLGICIKSMSWVLNQTEYTSNDTNGLRRILYSQDPSYPYYFTGYQSGASGIGDFLLTLYNVTNQADYLLYAKQFANWLIFQEEGKGYWENFNAVDYLTNQETNNWEGTFLGYSAGSSGVGIFLMDLFTKTNDTRYLGPVERIKNFLINNSITNGTELYWKDQIKGNFENRTDTGLSTGVAGIGLFFIKYYQFFGTSEILSTLNGILNFYNAITTSDGLVPYLIGATNVIYDSSYFDGLTGISLYFLEVNKTILDQPLFSTTILNNIQNFTFSNTKNFYALYLNNALVSTKPISSNSANYSQTLTSYETSHSKTASFSYLTFSVILILAITGIKRRIRNKK